MAKKIIKPKGLQLLVKLIDVDEKSDGGIILGTSTELEREQAGQFIGEVEDISPFAFSDWEDLGDTLEDRCENYGVHIGSAVIFQRYDGVAPPIPEFKNHRLIPSHCIIGVLEN